ncbi:MAG: ChrR family anti-sigma-E factor [Hyphomonadaceae bacterium]
MNPRHHPSVEILTAYASGALEPGFGLVVGAHVEGCAACRAKIGAFEAASGAALSELSAEDVSADALADVMARLDETQTSAPKVDTRPLLERLTLKPKKWVAPGVWVAAVDTPHAPQNRVYLLSVAPGMPTARHEHSGAEFCTVLKGAYRDELGVFAAGDFAAAYGELNHQPMVEGDETCVCLFATEGRLKPQGFLGRLAFGLANV